jgi:iron complex outermembrane receptor protein
MLGEGGYMSKRTLRTLALTGTACVMATPAAWAQDRSQDKDKVEAAAPAAQADDAAAPAITVTGIRQQYRGDVPIQDLPQSVSIISGQMLADVGVTQLDAALDLASGVNRQNNFGGIWDSFAIRGFAGDENLPSGVLVNGFNAGRGFGGPRDASNVDRIEVLKGPNSALFGRGEPGGTVNVVTKKPQFSPEGSFTLSAGSFRTVRAEGDYTTPLSNSIAVRVNGAYNYTENFRDVLSTTRYTVTPSVLIKITPSDILSYELEYINLKVPFDRGVIAVNGQLGQVPRKRFFGEPGDGRNHIDALGHQLQFQHKFSKNWNVLFGFGYRETSFNGFSSDPEITPARQLLYLRPDLGRLSRQRRYRDYDTENLVARAEVSGEFHTGTIKHHLLFGADYDKLDIDQIQTRFRPPTAAAQLTGANGNTIDIFNPVYGSRPTPGPFRNLLEKQRGWGAYLQDQIDITDSFKLRFGGRYDEFRPRTFFRTGDFNAAVGSTPSVTYTRFSPQVGAVYEISPAFSLYASYGTGFRPNSGTDVASNTFKPETTRSYEVGAKFALLGDALNGTIAVFDIKKNNVLTSDPVNAGFSLALGSARSRGAEFDLNGKLPGDFMIWLSYAYLDAEVGQDAGDPNFGFPILKGDPLLNIPKHSGNLLVTKDIPISNDKLTIGGGINYVSSRLGETGIKSFRLPAYTLVKLLASYEVSDHVRVSAEVNNLFDKNYYPSSYSRLWVSPGTPRAFTAHLSYRF